MNNYMYKQGIK